MGATGNLLFEFFDVHGERPDDRVDVLVKHNELSQSHNERNFSTKKRLKIKNLDSSSGGIYSVQIFPLRRRPVSRFVKVLEDKTLQQTFILPVDPDRVVAVEFPAFDQLGDDLQQVLSESNSVEGNEGSAGRALFDALDDFRKAGLLNIYAKMRNTVFPSGKNVFSFVSQFNRIRAQRFFARVLKEMRDEVINSVASNLFREVSGALHTPPPGFQSVDSFKTREDYGNLQLTFFSKPESLEFVVDADLDDAQGVEHIFQVLRPIFTGENTNPFDIHEILIMHHKIDPGYRLVV